MNEIAIVVALIIGGWVLMSWLLFPFIVGKGLESIRKAIEELDDK